ncbi:hypothetical protein O6H91_18G075600 [Diphasiastrum complanatum]|uniref:Uncharacterized protein n=1 Tax=Diphasiastrum complanatum TaxID=34168 RepID=A0ACC2B2Q7_DIPCM|nr:hypothetical protein O6H91_18G075600 [Diphasiastrum complanatum]
MSYQDAIDQGLIDGTKAAIDNCLGLIPVVGGFVTTIFDQFWGLAFAGRTADAQKAAMDSLYKSVQKMIDASIDEVVLSQGRELNASMVEFGQDYHVSVQSFKNGETNDTATIKARFETCKTNLVHMLNLFSQERYMNLLVLSYGSALSMYVQLLSEMVLNGKDTGYTPSEIANFQKEINNKITIGLTTIGEAIRKFAPSVESGHLNDVEWITDSLQKLVAGLMSFNKDWYPKPVVLATEDYNYYPYTDAVDNNACYQLRTQKDSRASLGTPALQIYMAGDHFVHHIYENLTTPLRLGRFGSKNSMTAKLRAVFLADIDDPDASDVVVTLSKVGVTTSTIASFNLRNPSTTICTFPWVKLYRPGSQGYPFSGNPDLISIKMTMRFVEFDNAVSLDSDSVYEIHTKAGSASVKSYYIIGFQLIPQ